jgi:hypothetical protein
LALSSALFEDFLPCFIIDMFVQCCDEGGDPFFVTPGHVDYPLEELHAWFSYFNVGVGVSLKEQAS